MTEEDKDAFIVQLRSEVTMYRDAYRATLRTLELANKELINSAKFVDGLREKHKKVLAGNSKALFTEAVKLDQKLKEMNDEE